MGGPLGNLEGGLFTRDLHVEEGSGDGRLSLHTGPVGELGGWVSIYLGALRYS